MRTESDINETITKYADTVKRICLCHLKNYADMEDLFQIIFIKYMMYDGDFESEEHKKAWILKISSNACKDYLRTHFWKKKDTVDLLKHAFAPSTEEIHIEVMEEILKLPDKYKVPIYLYYYEGYTALEIAKILEKKENTIYSLLSRGRKILKGRLENEG